MTDREDLPTRENPSILDILDRRKSSGEGDPSSPFGVQQTQAIATATRTKHPVDVASDKTTVVSDTQSPTIEQPNLEPDEAMMAATLHHVFGDVPTELQDGLIEIAYSDRTTGKISKAQHFTLDELATAATFAAGENARPGVNVYYGVALRSPYSPNRRTGKEHVYGTTTLWADFDHDDQYQQIIEKMKFCPPTAGIVTGRVPTSRRQTLWRISSPLTSVNEIEDALQGIFDHLGGDPACIDASRVMRLAGSISYAKADKPGRIDERTELHTGMPGRPAQYETDHLRRIYTRAPSAAQDQQSGGQYRGAISNKVDIERTLRDVRDGNWHEPMLRVVGSLVGRGHRDDEIRYLLAPYCKDGINDDDLTPMISGARSNLQKPDPAINTAILGVDQQPIEGTATQEASTGTRFPIGHQMRPNGLYWTDPIDPEKSFRLSGPFEVVAETRDADDTAWGLLLAWKDADGNAHEWAMPRACLAGDGVDVRRHLLDGGLDVTSNRVGREKLTEFLIQARTEGRARAVSRVGWHDDIFVLPDLTIGDNEGERVLLQTETPFNHAFRVAGTLADWNKDLGRYCVGNSRLAFSVSAALAAPLLSLTGSESGGFHFRGASSIGKSTSLLVAGSVWGGGSLKGYVRQWRATDNGLEGTAQGHCDALLCLDELSQIDAKSAGATAYMLANGAGKARAGRSGEGRKIAEWRTLFLSNGEIGIANKVAEDGRKKITAGQQVRVIDVPADAGQHLGIFEHLHEFTDPDLFARHLKSAATTCYGSLCRAFIDVIARDVTALGENVVSFCNAFIEAQCPANADGQIKRIAHRFGLVATAGELAIANGTLDWPKGEALRAAEICFRDWLRERGSIEPAEIAEGIKQIRGFIEAHGESRFADWPGILSTPIRPTINRVGFRKAQRDGNDDHYTYEYYILPEAWKSEICAGRDSGAISRAMADRGMLKTEKSGRPQVTVRLPEHKKPRRCYVVTQELFNDGPDVTPGTRSVPDGDDTKSRATGATGATNGPQASESAVSGSTATVAPASSGNATSATKLIDYDDIRRFLAGEGGPVAPVARALPQAGQAAALPNTNINQDVAQDVAHVASVTRDSEREPQPALRSPLLARSPAPVSITHCNDCSEAFGSGESGLAHIRGPLHEHCHEVRSRSLSLVPNNGPGL